MNANTMILRLLNRTRILCRKNGHLTRCLLQDASKVMSTNAFVPQLAKERETFQDAWQGIIDSLTRNQKFKELPELGSWLMEILDYNIKGGKKIRGIATVLAYELLEKPENVTEEKMRLAHIAGWGTEMLQVYLIMNDDIMDGSPTRRGMPCWYTMPKVGLGAINDAILVYGAMFEVLKIYFGNTEYYVDILDIFNEGLLYTSMGQHLDYAMVHRDRHDYSMFTIERYNSIVKYKTSYYTVRMPILLGLLLTEGRKNAPVQQIEDICFEIGKLFQIQDDFIDCFGDESVTGKAGTDIQEGKCSWLAVNALQRCNESQREIFIQNYASKDQTHISNIKKLYDELKLKHVYRKQEGEIYNGILEKINNLPSHISPAIFFKFLEIIYKRNN